MGNARGMGQFKRSMTKAITIPKPIPSPCPERTSLVPDKMLYLRIALENAPQLCYNGTKGQGRSRHCIRSQGRNGITMPYSPEHFSSRSLSISYLSFHGFRRVSTVRLLSCTALSSLRGVHLLHSESFISESGGILLRSLYFC